MGKKRFFEDLTGLECIFNKDIVIKNEITAYFAMFKISS